jgi:hypothetical protein
MRILLDQNVPLGVRGIIRAGHPERHVTTAYHRGWSNLSNGDLLSAAETDGFDLFVTCDQNIAYQQNLVGRRIRVVVLWTNRWRLRQAEAGRIKALLSDR